MDHLALLLHDVFFLPVLALLVLKYLSLPLHKIYLVKNGLLLLELALLSVNYLYLPLQVQSLVQNVILLLLLLLLVPAVFLIKKLSSLVIRNNLSFIDSRSSIVSVNRSPTGKNHWKTN